MNKLFPLLLFFIIILTGNSYAQGSSGREFSLDQNTIWISQHPSAEKDKAPFNNIPYLFIQAADGIEKMIGKDDVVAIKVTASNPEQGFTNSNILKAFIDNILNRQGGFGGFIVIFDNIHLKDPGKQPLCGWNPDVSRNAARHNGSGLDSVIKEYEKTGMVGRVYIEDVSINPEKWIVLNAKNPDYRKLPEGKNGWLRYRITIPSSSRDVTLSVPVFRLPDGRVIDLSRDGGVYKDGKKCPEALKFFIASPLNYHSRYAGIDGSVLAHLGLVELPGGNDPKEGHFEDGSFNLLTLGYPDNKPEWVGSAIGLYIKNYLYPAYYMCCAEWVGIAGSYGAGTATQVKQIALCKDPVTLDYYMGKYTLFDADRSRLWNNPDSDSAFGRTLKGCNEMKVGTIDENNMVLRLYDADNPRTRVKDWEFFK